jgi:hypothetical protein
MSFSIRSQQNVDEELPEQSFALLRNAQKRPFGGALILTN